MKKNYIRPNIVVEAFCQNDIIMTSNITETETETIPYYTDDPQDPGNALSRQNGRNLWDEEKDVTYVTGTGE